MLRYVLSSSVQFSPQSNGNVRIFNGVNAQWTASSDAVSLLQLFSLPHTISEAIDEAGGSDQARQFLDMMIHGLVLVSEDVDHETNMRLAWDCLAQGTDSDAAFVIDNETKTMEEFSVAGREGIEALNNILTLDPSWNVVNIGCGMGRLELPLSHRVASVTGFDVSEKMLERARNYLSGRKNVHLRRTDSRLVGIDDDAMDLVISFLVFQHCPDEVTWEYFREAYRVLSTGGHFVFQILCYDDNVGYDASEHSPLNRYYGSGKVRYRHNEVQHCLSDIGFSIEKFREGSHSGVERRLAGTSSPNWESVIVHASKN